MTAQELAERLPIAQRDRNGQSFKVKCPVHDDKQASLAIRQESTKILLHCHAGCPPADIVAAMGLSMADLFSDKPRKPDNGHAKPRGNGKHPRPPRPARDSKPGKIVAEYDYHSADGKLLFQVVRLDPKSFRQRRPDDHGGWTWGLGDTDPVLFKLPDVFDAIDDGKMIVICEGEKDCDRLHSLGITATTSPMGAGKWRPEYTESLRDGHIAILPDNDDPGRNHAEMVSQALDGVAATVRVVELPGVDEKQDVSDWLGIEGNDADKLKALIKAAPLWESRPVTNQHAKTTTGACFGNHDLHKNGKTALPVTEIDRRLCARTQGFPKRVDSMLFTITGDAIRWLDSPEHLFAWIAERGPIAWTHGSDSDAIMLLSKQEYYCHLQSTAERFDAVETLPHEPPITKTFYAWNQPKDYKPNGSKLAELLDYFDNVETDHDRDLIKAMFMSPAWGGLPGTRPAFAVMACDRGCGKSTLTDAVAELYGGAIEIDPSPRAQEDRIVSRLLTPSACERRIVRLDNIKSTVSSGLIEGLITGTRISGHRLYHGDSTRTNHLTWLLTGNTMRLSRDIADRSFIIRLTRPTPRPGWRENVFQFIRDHKHEILADVIQALKGPVLSLPAFDRWLSWSDDVLRRVSANAPDVVALNQQRRDSNDTDLEEAQLIHDAIMAAEDVNWSTSGIAFVTGTRMTAIINEELGEHWTTRKTANILQGHIEAGRLPYSKERTMGARGFQVRRDQEE